MVNPLFLTKQTFPVFGYQKLSISLRMVDISRAHDAYASVYTEVARHARAKFITRTAHTFLCL